MIWVPAVHCNCIDLLLRVPWFVIPTFPYVCEGPIQWHSTLEVPQYCLSYVFNMKVSSCFMVYSCPFSFHTQFSWFKAKSMRLQSSCSFMNTCYQPQVALHMCSSSLFVCLFLCFFVSCFLPSHIIPSSFSFLLLSSSRFPSFVELWNGNNNSCV